jgi:hypothetical protein
MAASEPGTFGPDDRCAVLARALDEPLAGTAPSTGRWLCLEHPEPWPYDITRHPDPAIRAFVHRAAASGFRPLLVRRPDGRADGAVRRVLLADTDPVRAEVTVQTVTGLDALAELPLPAPGRSMPGDAAAGVLLLVCTHAERDRCCGTDGRGLADALAAAGEPNVWESSHLGGHRFAPTALVLPSGYLYGHLDLRCAIAIRAAAAVGTVVVERCRGRSTWSPEGQVAELAVRAAADLHSAADVVVEPNDDGGPVMVVRDRSGTRWAVEIDVLDVDSVRPASCGARSTLMVPLRAGLVRRL